MLLAFCLLVPSLVRGQSGSAPSEKSNVLTVADLAVFSGLEAGVPESEKHCTKLPPRTQLLAPTGGDAMIQFIERWLGRFFQNEVVPDRGFVAANLLLAPALARADGKCKDGQDVAFLPVRLGNYNILVAITGPCPLDQEQAVFSVVFRETQKLDSAEDASRIVGAFSSNCLLYTWTEWTQPSPASHPIPHSKILSAIDFVASQVADHYEVVPKSTDVGGRFDTLKAVVFKNHLVIWFKLYGRHGNRGALISEPNRWFEFEREKAKR